MKFKRLLAIALSVMVMFTIGAASGVFAAGQNANKTGATDKDYSASEAKLVKYVTAAEGVTLPTETFTFTFTPADVAAADVKDYTVPKASHPTGKTATIATGDLAEATAGSGKWVGSVAIKDIFTQGLTTATPAGDFPRAGEYTFTVAETAGSTTGMTYSSDTYILRLIVDKDGNIDDVTVQVPGGDKVDATDVTPTDNSPAATPAASNGGFTFTNNYVKLIDKHPDPTKPNPDYNPDKPAGPDNRPYLESNGALQVEKLVTGEYADYTKDWVFEVSVTVPDNTTGYTLADHTPADMALKTGESFAYDVLPAGSKITITETDANAKGYTTTYEGTYTGVANATEFMLTEEGQLVKVTNAFDDSSVTPTGILINNLPYIILILLALGGIVLFARKRRYQ